MRNLIIITAGGFGREVHFLVEEINAHTVNGWEIKGFVDDDQQLVDTKVNGIPVLGSIASLRDISEDTDVAIAVGNPGLRESIYLQLRSNPLLHFPNLIHPVVTIMNSNKIGIGNIICKGSVLTVNITVGDFIIINLNCTIGHVVCLEDFCTLAPNVNLSGCVKLERGVELGTNVIVIPSKTVGSKSLIGAGGVITTDIPSNVLAVGAPAKVIRSLNC